MTEFIFCNDFAVHVLNKKRMYFCSYVMLYRCNGFVYRFLFPLTVALEARNSEI